MISGFANPDGTGNGNWSDPEGGTTPDRREDAADFELEVTRVVGLVMFRRPDLAERYSTHELRRIAPEIYRRPIPRAFREAFDDR